MQNALAAIAAARALGVAAGRDRRGARGARRACPGRFEPVDEGQDFAVLVDYAHTPDSLENVLRAAREITDGRLHVVFGAGGDRDRAKRPLMGRAAAELRRPRDRDLRQPALGGPRRRSSTRSLEGAGAAPSVIVDRRAAIALAIERPSPATSS